MPRTAVVTTLVALALLAGAYVLPHAPVGEIARAGLVPLGLPISDTMPISTVDDAN